MARIAGVNIPNNQHVAIALTAIYGIGNSISKKICINVGIDTTKKMNELSEQQIEI